MSATKLDGTLYRDEIFSDLAQRVSALKEARRERGACQPQGECGAGIAHLRTVPPRELAIHAVA